MPHPKVFWLIFFISLNPLVLAVYTLKVLRKTTFIINYFLEYQVLQLPQNHWMIDLLIFHSLYFTIAQTN